MSQREPFVKEFDVVGETVPGGNYKLTVYPRGKDDPVVSFECATMFAAHDALAQAGYKRAPEDAEKLCRCVGENFVAMNITDGRGYCLRCGRAV